MSLRALLSVLLGVGATALATGAGCASVEDEGSESHFLCHQDGDCYVFGPGARCIEQRCEAPEHDAGGGAARPPLTRTDKVDLLFVIDNSPSMADKRSILALTVPDLVDRLVNPPCAHPETGEQTAPPLDPSAPCPEPFVRAYDPITDLHVGVISSSLGSYGASACESGEERNDSGRLVAARPRSLALGLADEADGVPGFLRWEGSGDVASWKSPFIELVGAVGHDGCRYESTLEAWYRFLVDPEPPAEVATVECPMGGDCAERQGIDERLLEQRRQFLRPDSLLSIVMITDENDCSINGMGQWYYAARTISLPASASVCTTNPNDPCCYSCAFPTPEGCTPDPLCKSDGSIRFVPDEQDAMNLRCWEQKRRYGVDFLYPLGRYLEGLTEPEVCVPEPSDVADEGYVSDTCSRRLPNPIFQDLSETGRSVRRPEHVLLTGIVGVPWQDIVADVDEEGRPWPAHDADSNGTVDHLHYQTAAQMRGAANDDASRDTWATILGRPAASPPVPPLDPLMHESIVARAGVSPSTGISLAGPGADYMANPINGHEWANPNQDDLQYACIFPLLEPRDCTREGETAETCACTNADGALASQNPLCQEPDGGYGTLQHFAKAYPGLRHLQLLRDLEDRGIVGSICPANTTDANAQAFGYRPVLDAMVARMALRLARPSALDLAEVPTGDGDPLPPDVEALFGQAGGSSPEVQAYANLYGTPLSAPFDPSACGGGGADFVRIDCVEYYRCSVPCETDDECGVGQASGRCTNGACRAECNASARCATGMSCIAGPEGQTCRWAAPLPEPCPE